MARVCDLTGKKRMIGNNVSHSLNRTKRKFNTNLINKIGIKAALENAKSEGFLK